MGSRPACGRAVGGRHSGSGRGAESRGPASRGRPSPGVRRRASRPPALTMLAANGPPLLASEERVDTAAGPGPPPGPPPPRSSRSGESQLSGGGGGGGSGLSSERLRRCYGSVPSPGDWEQRARRRPHVVSERPGTCGTREELLDEPEWTHPSTQRGHLLSVCSPGHHPSLGRMCHVPKAQGCTHPRALWFPAAILRLLLLFSL